ncbi:MAG: thioredoxin family protein [Draconibacterium sp.]|nr:thioredoxin family protein [Draconibacterium sp.]
MIKKVLLWFVFILLFALLIIGFSLKDNMNNYLSEMMQKQVSPELAKSGNILVDSLYNYSTNGLNYKITFLEFGAKNCSACKRMEKVMEETRKKYPNNINVVFLNILKPESQVLMKFYGIASIPTQILLDKTGNEFFRHSGFISFAELEKQYLDNSF